MVPSPENDGAPKAPDKKGDEGRGAPDDRKPDDANKQETDFYNLNEKDLKHLLDEAISYKSPKDREGKSELFNNLLTDAENELRNARATSASGPETVRHYNKRATKRHGKGRKASSISENLTHSGSLNNLTKEDLFEETIRQRPKKTVSARQTEGGSLPCNVNVGAFDQYLDDFRPMREINETKPGGCGGGVGERDAISVEAMRKKNEADVIESLNSLSTTLSAGVDDRIPVSVLDHVPSVDVVKYKKSPETTVTNSFLPSNITGGLPFNGRGHRDEKKVDENCNAVPQQPDGRKVKAKKKLMEKNVTVWESSKVTGHRSDIINDVDKLIDYIDGTDVRKDKPAKSNVQKRLQKNIFDDGKASSAGKKQRARAKAKAGGSLQKSNSLEEMSTTKIEDFEFLPEDNVVLRQAKGNGDRPRERRSWGNSEPVQVQGLYTNASAENLETADFHVVTKKKKSKKQRRNSLSGRKTYRGDDAASSGDLDRAPSPEPRRKSAISVPHSEKSNDSSDVDSVHSLPVDAGDLSSREMADDEANFPVSYADIAKNTSNNNGNGNNNVNAGVSGNGNGVSDKGRLGNNNNNNNNSVVNVKSVRKEKLKSPGEKQGSIEIVDVSKSEKESDRIIKVKKEEVKKPTAPKVEKEKEVSKPEEKTVTNIINSVNYTQNFPSIVSKDKNQEGKVRNPIAEIQTWPAIPNVNNNKNNLKNTIINNQKKMQNHFRNTRNVSQQKTEKGFGPVQSPGDALIYNSYNVPINIPDVRQIEKQFKNSAKLYDASPQIGEVKKPCLGQEGGEEGSLNNNVTINSPLNRTISNTTLHSNDLIPSNNNNTSTCTTSTMNTTTNNNNSISNNANYNTAINVNNNNNNSATANANVNSRPAVVILSGAAENEVSGITFGFDIEQLLSNDVCADFMARFVPPPRGDDVSRNFNLEKIVNYVGVAWEDIIKETNGRVQYYTESL